MVNATEALPVMNSKNGFQSVKFMLRIKSPCNYSDTPSFVGGI